MEHHLRRPTVEAIASVAELIIMLATSQTRVDRRGTDSR